MAEKLYNEPAFPCSSEQMNRGDAWAGMSLRDWFAGMVLQGYIARSSGNADRIDESAIAERVYEIADAMLAARVKSPDSQEERNG